MSAPKLTKKQKKGLAFRERKGKKKSDTLPEEGAIPEADLVEDKEVEIDIRQPETQRKSIEKPQKRKREAAEDVTQLVGGKQETASAEDTVEDLSTRKSKKRKISEEDEEEMATPGKSRFILFVGNLKYTTSLDAIQEHFSNCDPPPQVRLLTPKPKSPSSAVTKSKGCAFLEFSHRNALQQGLKLHASTLDGRRINVELTAGGGGKSEKRLQKVKTRNKQLLEERKTRVQKKAESSGETDPNLIAPPQRHSTTSGLEDAPQIKRTWTVPEEGEVSGRGGVKKRSKKGKAQVRHWGTGANAITVG